MICTLTQTERYIYLAGIFDGEGCVGLWNQKPKGKNPSATLQLRISMTTPYAVQLLHETFGGALFASAKRSGKRRQTFTWSIYSTKAEAALRAMLPYLREKREQAEIAIAFVTTRRKRHVGSGHALSPEEVAERDTIVQRLKELKRQEFAATAIH